MHQTALTERRRRRRDITDGRTKANNNNGAVLFFDISGFTGNRVVLVETAKLVLEVRGSGRLAVVQRVGGGGGITLDSVLVQEEQSEVEMEVMDDFFLFLFSMKLFPLQVRHAVQGWILEARLNLGLEVQGDLEVGRATLQINSKVRLTV